MEIQKCDKMIQAKLGELNTHVNYKETEDSDFLGIAKRRKSLRKPHEFSFDLGKEITRITGVNLTLLPAIGLSTALALISETGLDMKVWKSEKHFTSWLGVSANNKVSGGRILQNRTKRKKKKIAITLRMAVSGLYREANDTALGAFSQKTGADRSSQSDHSSSKQTGAHVLQNNVNRNSFCRTGSSSIFGTSKGQILEKSQKAS